MSQASLILIKQLVLDEYLDRKSSVLKRNVFRQTHINQLKPLMFVNITTAGPSHQNALVTTRK